MGYLNDIEEINCLVNLYLTGPIRLGEVYINFEKRKDSEYNIPLFLNIGFNDGGHYIAVKLNSFAHSVELSKTWALLFLGVAIDVLSVHTNCPIKIRQEGDRNYRDEKFIERRILTEKELFNAFREARLLKFTEPAFLTALGWYRKGLISENIFDSYLAFYNSIEIIADNYHTPIEINSGNSINKIVQCFTELWGEDTNSWKFDDKWNDEFSLIRNKIAHGLLNFDVKSIAEISRMNGVLKEVAYNFIVDWRKNKLKPENKLTPEIISKLKSEK